MRNLMELEVGDAGPQELLVYKEVFNALIKTGGLTGVKGGRTIIHFDGEGVFQTIQLDYYPWRKRKVN